VLAKTARKGKTPLHFLPSLFQHLGDTTSPALQLSCSQLPFNLSWQPALGKILLFLWWWKVMASRSSESQKREKPS